MQNSIKSMLKILKKKYFLFQSCKNTQQKNYNIFSISFKQNEKRLLLLLSEIIGDIALSVCKTKIPTEYREKGITCLKN